MIAAMIEIIVEGIVFETVVQSVVLAPAHRVTVVVAMVKFTMKFAMVEIVVKTGVAAPAARVVVVVGQGWRGETSSGYDGGRGQQFANHGFAPRIVWV